MAPSTRQTVPAAAVGALAAGGAAVVAKRTHDRRARRDETKRVRRYRLAPDEDGAEGVRRMARGQLDLASERLDTDSGGDLDGAVHDAPARAGAGGARRARRRGLPAREHGLPRCGARALHGARCRRHGGDARRPHRASPRGALPRRVRRPARCAGVRGRGGQRAASSASIGAGARRSWPHSAGLTPTTCTSCASAPRTCGTPPRSCARSSPRR